MEKLNKYLPWTIRIFIFLMFMVSAASKMFPIWIFEKQFVDLGVATWCWAPYFARVMIAIEIALGIAIIQPHFIKRLVVPATVMLLVVFNVHLTIQMINHGAMTGNCGCFGQLIPMTPLEAFIKNIVFIAMLVYLFFHVNDKEKGKNKFAYLAVIALSSTLFMFLLFPFCPCKKTSETAVPVFEADSTTMAIQDTSIAVDVNMITDTTKNATSSKTPSNNITKKRSRFSEFRAFGNTRVDLDEGSKIVCFFAPGCEHCVETAKELQHLSETSNIPDVYVFFMDEEVEKIPQFQSECHCKFPYIILDIRRFWELLGSNADTPGVYLLNNGEIVKFYEGTEENAFNINDFKKACEKL
ncbi:MAG TPA: MauE/DoxX family redox-associated membrane protein [Bacteroidales bacterium]|nr:MauE/DoxX family redox-associated membrane protein [Bacteroidales bacterium]HQN94573.1 MauE/DoxX family redox-associated membrane protein [Prolixibacteraceae bacterium]